MPGRPPDLQVEPTEGSTAGGTEVHVAGAGFAYVTQALGFI